MSQAPADIVSQEFDIGKSGAFRGDLDPEYLIRLQINRCAIAQTTGDEAMYAGAVLALVTQLPSGKRKEIEDERGDYMEWVEEWEYKTISGWRVGTPERPVYRNLPEDDDYDPYLKQTVIEKKIEKRTVKRLNEETGETEEAEVEYEVEAERETQGQPVLVSPKLVKREKIDYHKLNIKAMEKLQTSGLTWKMDKVEIFTGEEWTPEMAEADEKVAPITGSG